MRNLKKIKQFCVHPIKSSTSRKGKFYWLYEDPQEHPKIVFRYFRMPSVTFDKVLQIVYKGLI